MAEKRVIELEVKTDSVGSLKSELRKAQAEVAALSEKFGATSQEAINAAKRAAELKDAIGDAKALTDAYNPDAKFNALSQSIGGVLNGFQAFEGALGLVGVQSKDVEEALLAVNSAMALSQGVAGVLESVDSFKTLATQVSNLTIVQKLSTAAQWLWNAAMNANPIGAITVAITALIVTGYKLISWFNESADAADKANASMDRHTKALERQQKQLETQSKNLKQANQYQYDYAKAAGASSEQLRKLAIKHQEEELALAKKNLELAKSTYLREQDILASYRANDASEELIERQTEIVKKAREATTKARESLTQEYDDLKSLRLQQKVEIRQEETDANKDAQVRAKEAAEKRREAAKEAKEKALQDEKDNNEKIKKAAKDLSDELNDIADKALQKQKEDQQKRKEEAEKAEKAIYDNAKGYAEAKVIEDQNNLQAKIDLLAIEKSIVLQNKELTEGEIAAIEAKYRKERDSLEEQAAEKQKQINQQRIDLVLKYAQTFGNAMGSLSNLLNVQDNERLKNVKRGSKEEEAIKKKMFERDKKLRIVQTIIDTASNVVQSVRNGGGIPAGIPFGVAAGVMGALQIAAIKKTSFDAGGGEQPPASGGAGSSGPVAANVITPNFNVVGNAQATNPLAGLGAQPIQAYVVSGEVTTAQSLDRNRVNYATFG
jgi:hypothetical protein